MTKQDTLGKQAKEVYLGIGSNLGNRISNIEKAKYKLSENGVEIIKSSAYYETLSWPDPKNPKFYNIVIKILANLMTNSASSEPKRKLKFEGSEYYMDSLPDQVKQLVAGLNAADLQTKMYQDTLKLIAVGKSKLIQDLKKSLEDIDPIDNN